MLLWSDEGSVCVQERKSVSTPVGITRQLLEEMQPSPSGMRQTGNLTPLFQPPNTHTDPHRKAKAGSGSDKQEWPQTKKQLKHISEKRGTRRPTRASCVYRVTARNVTSPEPRES